MAIRTELSLRLPNSPGALAGVCRVLADQNVRILALSLDAHGQCRIVVDHSVRAAAALRSHHHGISERDVIFVALHADPAAPSAVLALLRDAGINVNYAYSGVSDSRTTAAMVVGVDDAQRAAASAGI